MFREVRRVLKPQATLWIEVGDSYNANTGRGFDTNQDSGDRKAAAALRQRPAAGIKPKDLILQPFLLAEALRRDGWYLRQIIVWSRPNPMPESVRDRCATAHSYVLLLAKSRSYYFDAEAIAEPASENTHSRGRGSSPKMDAKSANGMGHEGWGASTLGHVTEKNARSVWSIPTEGFSDAHFATFPQALVERIIKAGCPEWVCKACGKPRERIVETTGEWRAQHDRVGKHDGTIYRTNPGGGVSGANTTRQRTDLGWSDCGCGAGFTPGVCLDPFMGSGTTALVARRLGRSAVGVELNADYCAMAAARTGQLSLLAEAPL